MPKNYRHNQKRNLHNRGQSLVELALLLPFLLVLIIGALEFGRLFFTKIVITNAAREAAYYMSFDPSLANQPNATAAAEAEAANSGIPSITVSYVLTDLGGYDSIEVTVDTNVENIFLLRIVGNAISAANTNTFHLSSTVEMMVQ